MIESRPPLLGKASVLIGSAIVLHARWWPFLHMNTSRGARRRVVINVFKQKEAILGVFGCAAGNPPEEEGQLLLNSRILALGKNYQNLAPNGVLYHVRPRGASKKHVQLIFATLGGAKPFLFSLAINATDAASAAATRPVFATPLPPS